MFTNVWANIERDAGWGPSAISEFADDVRGPICQERLLFGPFGRVGGGGWVGALDLLLGPTDVSSEFYAAEFTVCTWGVDSRLIVYRLGRGQ